MEGPGDPDMDSDSESETMSPGPSLSSASLHGKKNINRGRWNKEEVRLFSYYLFHHLFNGSNIWVHNFIPNFRMKNLRGWWKSMGNDGTL